jgi:hypothetical protein
MSMNRERITRREFSRVRLFWPELPVVILQHRPVRQTHADRRGPGHLGKTGLKLSRLGIGTGSNSGNVQRSLGPTASTG